jgi:hypothetical protein
MLEMRRIRPEGAKSLQVLGISLTPCKSGGKEKMRRLESQEFVGQKTWPQAHTWPACCDALLDIFLSAASVNGPVARHLRLCEPIVALPKTCNQLVVRKLLQARAVQHEHQSKNPAITGTVCQAVPQSPLHFSGRVPEPCG